MEQNDLSRMVLDIVTNVCRRPRMFAAGEGFDGVASFLNGVHYAVEELHPEKRDPTGFRHLRYWLATKYASRCDGMHNLTWWAYIKAAFPDEAQRYEQLPLQFEESLRAREVPRPEAGACVLYYGIRVAVRGEEELAEMDDDEERTLKRVHRAGLASWWIPATVTGHPDTLLIGTQLGVYEGGEEASFDDAALIGAMEYTKGALRELGYPEDPALILRWDASLREKGDINEPFK